jgi:hypothetical protein
VDGRPRSSNGAAGFDPGAARASARARGETVDGLLDRNLAELLQELRVAITGVQILFAFLLGLAFTARFTQLGGYQVTVYTVALLSTALATIVLIAPVSFHRMVFRRRQKAALVVVADLMLRIGLGLLVLAITSAVLLILDVVLGRWQGLVGGGLVALAGALTWYALPVWARRAGIGAVPGPAEAASSVEDERAASHPGGGSGPFDVRVAVARGGGSGRGQRGGQGGDQDGVPL